MHETSSQVQISSSVLTFPISTNGQLLPKFVVAKDINFCLCAVRKDAAHVVRICGGKQFCFTKEEVRIFFRHGWQLPDLRTVRPEERIEQ